MTIPEGGVIVALALADSTSIGTLVIPVWLMIGSRAVPRRIALYLVVLAGFYWGAGLILLVSVNQVVPFVAQMSAGRAWGWSQLVIGAVVVALGVMVDRRSSSSARPSPRLQRWRSRALRPVEARGVIAFALAAGVLELAGMLPFFVAIGMLARSGLAPMHASAVLAIYVVIMMLPAVVLLTIRTFAGGRVSPLFELLERWLERHADVVIGTVLMAVGGLLAADAAIRLDLLPQ
ncbi:GAP family protein [Luethyella okanaganae]|uniref:GAP family protein n=1 Tax=Luethyella okanaganae TaxID=69372 RepID=A0ABW1VJJ6_9MICO